MTSLRVRDHLRLRVLVTRESARSLRTEIERVQREASGDLGLDFVGIDGLTPSFLDEMLGMLSDLNSQGESRTIHILNPPTRLSQKFLAVGRSHGLRILEMKDGTWVLTPEAIPS